MAHGRDRAETNGSNKQQNFNDGNAFTNETT
jgi:hypothetical protein